MNARIKVDLWNPLYIASIVRKPHDAVSNARNDIKEVRCET